MNLQALLIHSIWFIIAACFAGSVHAQSVPVEEANAQSTYIHHESTATQEYVGTHGDTSGAASAQTPWQEINAKVESLQSDLQKIRGQLDVQNHELQVMRVQNQALYRDLDARLTQLQAKKTPAKAANTTRRDNTAAVPETDVNGDAFYQAAYQMLQSKQYPRAISAFQVFLKNYPQSHYAANAHYWLGELYLSQGFIDKAKGEFQVVITKYKHSSKVPACLLKLGFAYYDNGEWLQARKTLNQVKTSYPDTDTARMATTRLRDMDQQGL